MTTILIGEDATGIECVKIMIGNFDPLATNDSQRARFHFNSKWPNQVTTPEIEVAPLVPFGSERKVYFPSGSGASGFAMMRHDASGFVSNYYVRGKLRYPSIRYDLPMMEVKWINPANGRYKQRQMTQRSFGQEYGPAGVVGGFVGTGGGGSWFRRQTFTDFTIDYSPEVLSGTETSTGSLLVWNLPGNDAPLDGPTTIPPGAGKYAIEIDSDACRVAKPGYDLRTATPAQLAFNSSGRPLSVIAAADIAIPVGVTTYDTGIPLPPNIHVEMSCYDDNANIYYPMKLAGNDNGYGIDYEYDGPLIRFFNVQAACRARFIVFGVDTLGPSTGTNDVLRHFSENGQDVVQFLRPGSGNPPRFSDIILDTRRPVIQILDEGYLTVPNGVTDQTVAFNAAGFFPYVKYMTHHGSGLNEEVRAPRVNRRYQNSLSPGGMGGDASYCKYNSTSATFYTAKGNSRYRYFSQSQGIVEVFDDNPIVGIRYFVLGIPA
ncbi:MAG: hypothetical protein ACT6U0_12295 [Shinella sp.]|uniref:hypothetical protein n=1 Tax=Shinella sp. TaxID=1870904 RepID=UPI0040361E08